MDNVTLPSSNNPANILQYRPQHELWELSAMAEGEYDDVDMVDTTVVLWIQILNQHFSVTEKKVSDV